MRFQDFQTVGEVTAFLDSRRAERERKLYHLNLFIMIETACLPILALAAKYLT